MSYYSPQARNAANLPHRVSFASFAEGSRIEGKLSDWKLEHDLLMRIGKLPQRTPRAQAKVKKKEEPNVDEILQRIAQTRAWLDEQPPPNRRKKISKVTYLDELKEMKKTGWQSVTEAAAICRIDMTTLRIWINVGIVKNVKLSKYRRKARFVLLEEVKNISQNRSLFIEKRKGKGKAA